MSAAAHIGPRGRGRRLLRRGSAESAARREERRFAWAMVSPTLLVVVVVALVPVLYTIYLSLHAGNVTRTGEFVGLDNYRTMVQDPALRDALKNTIIFTVVAVTIELALGLAIASVLNQRFRGRGLVRAAVLLPWAFPIVVSGLAFRLMLQDQIGILSYLAEKLHLVSGSILSEPSSLLGAIIVVDVWTSTPFMALLLLAGLQTIPQDVLEAARLDGASAPRRFFHVVLPLIKGPLLVALLFRTLQAWSAYDLFWVMAQRQVDSLSTYVYEGVRVSQLQFAPGTAAAVGVFVSSLAIAALFIRGFGAQGVQER